MKLAHYELTVNDDGSVNYSDSLYLSHTGITALPDNLTVGGYLDLSHTGITALPDNLTVGDSLYLSHTGITALPDNLTVGGYLDLSHTGITALPDNLTVGGSLYLSHTGITALPDNLTVGGYLDLSHTAITALPDNLTVGGYLDLSHTAITALPDNLTVGDSLYLSHTGITALPDNLTVGGSLYLSHTGITALPDNLTVGGSLYLSHTGITDTSKVNRISPDVLKFKNGKYIKVDGIFAEVINKKGNAWKLKEIGKKDVFFCVTDGHGKYAHGETIAKAKEDLIYKISGDASKEEFQNLTLDSVLSFDQCVKLYRVVTGSCVFGVRQFVESNAIEHRDYTLAEVIAKTNGAYGSETLKQFFGVK